MPSHFARWCTNELKLQPFEKYVGDDPVVSYVGIRGDEDREGYISKKSNIQSIFPFRQNIWSEDVVLKALSNKNISQLAKNYQQFAQSDKLSRLLEIIDEPISMSFPLNQKRDLLLDLDVKAFNKVVFEFLKTTNYPLSNEQMFPVVDNDDILIREDIFNLLRESGVGVPKYYEKITYEVNGKKGEYARSRPGCYFCFFQQKIEWVWLYEQHPRLFHQALEYEKEGYTWIQDEPLSVLIHPKRIIAIKEEHLKRMERIKSNKKSSFLVDVLDDEEDIGCVACFI